MTLEQFIAHLLQNLKDFEDKLREENKTNPEEWPIEFKSQFDWRKQLEAWMG
jgi:hypothetical protein